ncbi:MAG: hypothetical protein QNJ05_12505 [Woeseiaceae bacterium]|nr:hypothetical protein [Woeseiaceae bacterium]
MKPGIAEFDAGRLDPAEFSHEEHIRMGWLYLVNLGETDGTVRFREALKRFTKSVGAESRYHETITCFFLHEISARIDGSDWSGFRATNAELFDGKTLLDRHYSPETINSPHARQHYVAPDRASAPKQSN